MHRGCFAFGLFAALSGIALAQDVPLANWTVPAYRASSASGGLTTMTDVSPGVGFVGIQPCRVADTRGNGAPIQGGIFANSAQRTWDLTGLCGLPAGTDAISANFTVVAAGGIPAGSFLLAWPTGQAAPPTAIMTYGPGQTISNAAVVPLGPGEQLNVNVSGSTHVIMDVNGYFTDQYNPGVSFHAVSSNIAPAILGENTSTAANAVAIQGVVTSTNPGGFAAAVRGISNGIGPAISYGVYGSTVEAFNGSSGVLGVAGSRLTPGEPWADSTGVRGESSVGEGVLGLTLESGAGDYGRTGVSGLIINAGGSSSVRGLLGYTANGVHYGVYSLGNAGISGNLAVTGNFSSANKFFVEPHPSDASKEIRYVSLEGPHAEVYFRGTAQVASGISRIEIPQDFRFVADAATYSTLVTPLGGMATVAVLSEGPEGVVVQASRDVRVHYVVYAERAAIKNPNPIVENVDFRPIGDLDVFRALPESYRRLLVQNGTLNPDGTMNRDTARRLGWDKEWEKRNPPVALPAPE
jgi:hypothetical protein